jgi:hypothetical protein
MSLDAQAVAPDTATATATTRCGGIDAAAAITAYLAANRRSVARRGLEKRVAHTEVSWFASVLQEWWIALRGGLQAVTFLSVGAD